MTTRKQYHIALEPEVHKKLRVLAAERGETIGDVIKMLVKNVAIVGILRGRE